MDYPAPVTRLIDELRRLPGIGPKSAQRIAFHLLRGTREDAARLAEAIADAARRHPHLLDLQRGHRPRGLRPLHRPRAAARRPICVVEEPHDLAGGRAHPRLPRPLPRPARLALARSRGSGRTSCASHGLLDRVRTGVVDEVILATSPTVEGEATAVYLARLLKPLGVRVTRIAMGVPVGSDLEWADEVTMAKSLEGRREY